MSLSQFTWIDLVDILLVAIVIYALLRLTSRTRAMSVLKGLGLIIIAARIFEILGLSTVSWLLNYVINAGAIVIVILFQPEIRRALEKIGRGKFFEISTAGGANEQRCIDDLSHAILDLSKHKTGALLVFERKTGLREIIESGTLLNAVISRELILNICYPNTPMHDGAIIICDDRIVAAGCFLPLSDNKQIGSELGTRHRAALGVSEVSDAIVIIVSEETGVISMASEGALTRYLDVKQLDRVLSDVFIGKQNRFTKKTKNTEDDDE